MAMAPDSLDRLARDYTQAMTSIRGRRVQRLLRREFARYDHVLPALAEDGAAALLAWADDGRAAVCCTDGRGATVAVTEWSSLQGATLTTHCDLLKDSLPVLRWTLWHPGFAQAAGTLTIAADALPAADRERTTQWLRQL
jgi:hypothetical protein